jgi:hypothetical protein
VLIEGKGEVTWSVLAHSDGMDAKLTPTYWHLKVNVFHTNSFI